jgi:hypothetical protein
MEALMMVEVAAGLCRSGGMVADRQASTRDETIFPHNSYFE